MENKEKMKNEEEVEKNQKAIRTNPLKMALLVRKIYHESDFVKIYKLIDEAFKYHLGLKFNNILTNTILTNTDNEDELMNVFEYGFKRAIEEEFPIKKEETKRLNQEALNRLGEWKRRREKAKENKELSNKLQDELHDILTDEAKRIFDKAIKAGLMVVTETGCYEWGKNKALLAYMCGRIYCYDRIIKGECEESHILKKGSGFFPETKLSQLFNTNNLGQSHQQLKDRELPKGHECVDNLFDEGLLI